MVLIKFWQSLHLMLCLSRLHLGQLGPCDFQRLVLVLVEFFFLGLCVLKSQEVRSEFNNFFWLSYAKLRHLRNCGREQNIAWTSCYAGDGTGFLNAYLMSFFRIWDQNFSIIRLSERKFSIRRRFANRRHFTMATCSLLQRQSCRILSVTRFRQGSSKDF